MHIHTSSVFIHVCSLVWCVCVLYVCVNMCKYVYAYVCVCVNMCKYVYACAFVCVLTGRVKSHMPLLLSWSILFSVKCASSHDSCVCVCVCKHARARVRACVTHTHTHTHTHTGEVRGRGQSHVVNTHDLAEKTLLTRGEVSRGTVQQERLVAHVIVALCLDRQIDTDIDIHM